MRTCKQCGAALGAEARYCMQCGTPASEPAPEVAIPTADFVAPALAGGAALGLLSSIPIINAGNCLCCMWVVAGGALAAWLLGRQNPQGPQGVTHGDGAFVGVLSGLVGAVVATALSIPIRLLTAESLRSQQEAFEEMLREYPEIEGPMRELLRHLVSPELSFVTILITFLVNVILFSLFAMIGGILLVAVMGKKSGAPAGH